MMTLKWAFPLKDPHAGPLLGNGQMGLMVWGEQKLFITLARAGFWDHRSASKIASDATYEETRRLLEANDPVGLRQLYPGKVEVSGLPMRPRQMGGGRLVLTFVDGFRPVGGELELATATIRVALENVDGDKRTLTLKQARGADIAWLEDGEDVIERVDLISLWELLSEELAKAGVSAPQREAGSDWGGFRQNLPSDPALTLAWLKQKNKLLMSANLGDVGVDEAVEMLRNSDTQVLATDAQRYWANYWASAPRLELPDAELQEVWEFGLYKQAGLTCPCDVAATLQGPWMEDYQLPPWSNDYHFNINVQMIYEPALVTGKLEHFDPLWRMMRRWRAQMERRGAGFFGRPGAWMLPHAVDDQCTPMPGFWTGTVDHGCTAWMAMLAWKYYRYSLDESFLVELALPFLHGAFEGYWAMMEEGANGELGLPVTVSPEYKGARMDAWGRNASFQLSACHAVVNALQQAADLTGEAHDARWAEVKERLPQYVTIEASNTREYPEQKVVRIALWDGMDLEESHRHHSHLACIYPFNTIDPNDPHDAQIVSRTIEHWIRMGCGNWSGWSFPWTAILCARVGFGDGAVSWMRMWKQLFTNIGGGTLHDPAYNGISTLGYANVRNGERGEIMQMDAGLGMITAIAELLVQSRAEGIHVLPTIPRHWKHFQFDGLLAEGGFEIGGTVRNGMLVEIRVQSRSGGKVRLWHRLGCSEWIMTAGENRTLKLPI